MMTMKKPTIGHGLTYWMFGLWMMMVTTVAYAGQPDTIRIACVGNSITEGYGLKRMAADSYPGVMQRILGDGFKVMNFGYSGRTLMNSGDRPYMKEDRFRQALASQPDIVTIKLGTNDSKTANWQHKEQFVADLKAMVDSFRTLPSKPYIYLCLPVPPVGEKWTITDSIVYGEVIPKIWQVAGEYGLPVIDLYAPLKHYPEVFPDKIHPNRAGAALIAGEISRRLLLDLEQGKVTFGRMKAADKTSKSRWKFKRHKKPWR